jgi:hypothetical protein
MGSIFFQWKKQWKKAMEKSNGKKLWLIHHFSRILFCFFIFCAFLFGF